MPPKRDFRARNRASKLRLLSKSIVGSLTSSFVPGARRSSSSPVHNDDAPPAEVAEDHGDRGGGSGGGGGREGGGGAYNNPAKYRVVQLARKRAGMDVDSADLGTLDIGTVITVLERTLVSESGATRVRFQDETGTSCWVSLSAGTGTVLLQAVDETLGSEKTDATTQQSDQMGEDEIFEMVTKTRLALGHSRLAEGEFEAATVAFKAALQSCQASDMRSSSAEEARKGLQDVEEANSARCAYRRALPCVLRGNAKLMVPSGWPGRSDPACAQGSYLGASDHSHHWT